MIFLLKSLSLFSLFYLTYLFCLLLVSLVLFLLHLSWKALHVCTSGLAALRDNQENFVPRRMLLFFKKIKYLKYWTWQARNIYFHKKASLTKLLTFRVITSSFNNVVQEDMFEKINVLNRFYRILGLYPMLSCIYVKHYSTVMLHILPQFKPKFSCVWAVWS